MTNEEKKMCELYHDKIEDFMSWFYDGEGETLKELVTLTEKYYNEINNLPENVCEGMKFYIPNLSWQVAEAGVGEKEYTTIRPLNHYNYWEVVADDGSVLAVEEEIIIKLCSNFPITRFVYCGQFRNYRTLGC